MVRAKSHKRHSLNALGITLLVIVLLNVLFARHFYRFDLTQEKRFTITKATKNLLRDLDDQVYVTIYLAGKLPAEYRRLQIAASEMLDEYKAYSGNKIDYEFFDPFSLDNPEQTNALVQDLMSKGLETRQVSVQSQEEFSQKILIAGAVFHYHDKDIAANFLPEQKQMDDDAVQTVDHGIATLEYTISNTIRKLMLNQKQKIAFIRGHGELSTAQLADLSVTLQDQQYDLQFIDLPSMINISSTFDVAIIARPTKPFSEQDQFKIDQYIMNGGHVLWLIDPIYASLDSLLGQDAQDFTLTSDYPLKLKNQLFQYGVRVNYDLVMDERCAGIPLYRGNSSSPSFYPWYFYPIIVPDPTHPITKHLGPIRLNFASSIDTIKVPGLKKTILLHSSKNSRLMFNPIRLTLSMAGTKPDPVLFNKSDIPIAVLVEGIFHSVFKGRLPQQFLQIYRDSLGMKFKTESETNKMIVISDGDMLANEVDSRGVKYPLGYYRYNPNYIYANKDFVLNCIDYLTDNYGLIEARNKEFRTRPLNIQKVKAERFKWQMINLLLPLILLLLFGGIQNIARRRKYTGTL